MFCQLDNTVYGLPESFSLLSCQNRRYDVATILSALKKVVMYSKRPDALGRLRVALALSLNAFRDYKVP